ncbi:heterokaryon incompatibility protein-domain-containing protein, partial [Clohesyomyces aquaticus]
KYDNFYTPKNNDFYSKFSYRILDLNCIRLLRIKPCDPGNIRQAAIECYVIENVSLTDMKGKYTTISYAAGDPKRKETVMVNGISFNALSNLGHALRQARYFWKNKYGNRELLLWVDQICINQSNPSERSEQVNLMGEIYATAEQVLVCLSVENDISGGIEWIDQLL